MLPKYLKLNFFRKMPSQCLNEQFNSYHSDTSQVFEDLIIIHNFPGQSKPTSWHMSTRQANVTVQMEKATHKLSSAHIHTISLRSSGILHKHPHPHTSCEDRIAEQKRQQSSKLGRNCPGSITYKYVTLYKFLDFFELYSLLKLITPTLLSYCEEYMRRQTLSSLLLVLSVSLLHAT